MLLLSRELLDQRFSELDEYLKKEVNDPQRTKNRKLGLIGETIVEQFLSQFGEVKKGDWFNEEYDVIFENKKFEVKTATLLWSKDYFAINISSRSKILSSDGIFILRSIFSCERSTVLYFSKNQREIVIEEGNQLLFLRDKMTKILEVNDEYYISKLHEYSQTTYQPF